MGILKDVALVGVGVAAGIGAGYLLFDKETEVKEANINNCMEVYNEGIQEFDNEYASIESSKDLVTPREISIDYVAVEGSKENGDGLRALVVTDHKTEKNGFITRGRFNDELNIEFTSDLDELLSSGYDAAPFKPGLTVYSVADNTEPTQ